MTLVPHAVHPGVRVGPEHAVDAARRLTLDMPPERDRDVVAASLIASGCARLDHSASDRAQLLLGVLSERSTAPIRALRLGFARRHAQGGPPAVIWNVILAVRLPVLLMTLAFGGVALVTGLLTGEVGIPLTAAAWGIVVCAVSIVCHEAAHLLVLRALVGDRTVGAIEHSWLNVWVVGPAGGGRVQRVTALAGPPAGMLACVALAYAGVAEWLCWAVGLVHASNLWPSAPDGRVIFGRRQASPAPTSTAVARVQGSGTAGEVSARDAGA